MVLQPSRWPSVARGPARCALTVLAEFADKKCEKRTIDDLMRMAELSRQDRVLQLHETLKVGLARCAMRLHTMPFGFCNVPSIKRVTKSYVQNFRQVMEFENESGLERLDDWDYQNLTRNIFNMHRGTMLDVAKGVFEFYEELNSIFGDGLELAELRDDLPLILDIERALDEFFTTRLTLRLLISHVHSLNGLHTGAEFGQEKNMVGVVNKTTHPITILNRAYVAARFMCLRDFQMAPDLLVNGRPHDEFIATQGLATQQQFPYVHTHLFYIFLELVKNAARASIERAQMEAGDSRSKPQISPMHVIVPEKGMWELERSVKLADRGSGMNRSVLSKAFSYFYSSVKARPTVAKEVSDFDRRVPLAGFGFGLPISRVMARYFAGDIDLNSIPGQGTDVYVYL